MSQLNQASRIVPLLTKNFISCVKLKKQSMITIASQGLFEPILYSSSNSFSNPDKVSEDLYRKEEKTSNPNKLENSVQMITLRKNVSPRAGLKYAINRDNLVVDFFNLSKSVIENRISVEDFVRTDTFNKIQEEVEYNIDLLNNAHICNLLSSTIKMRINPSMNIVKILEHEVKFRLKLFNLNQVIKMLKFYNSVEMSAEQKQLADMLSFRIRSYVQNEATHIRDLNSILHLIALQQAPASMLGLVEERLTNMLTLVDDQDVVSRVLSKSVILDYESLCDIFIKIAENKRRPTPLLKAANSVLCKMNGAKENPDAVKPETLISTLNALVTLNFPNRNLITKLMDDLSEIIKLEELDSYSKCNLLRIVSTLRWRPDNLLKKFFDHNHECRARDHHLTTTLLHVASLVNYKPQEHSEEFYDYYVKKENEDMIDKQSRKWLSYVWSLVALNAADETHLRSVLKEEFYKSLKAQNTKFTFSDAMRLLNLKALAQYEYKLDNLTCDHLMELTENKILRSAEMQKFASKIDQALAGIVKSREIPRQVTTPFGFSVDCEISINDKNEIVPPDDSDSILATLKSSNISETTANIKPNHQKCSIIYAYYEDTIANTNGEVVGHKKMAARILKSLGHRAVFLPEVVLVREKTSADLYERIKALILAPEP